MKRAKQGNLIARFFLNPGYEKQGDLEKAFRFLVLFLLLFAFAYALLAFTPLKQALGLAAAYSSQFALGLFGVRTSIGVLQNGNYSLEGNSFTAELNEACAALIEIAVLFGIIFASFEKTLRKRAKGFAVGLVLLLVFNPLRIALSVMFLDPIVHDVLFRVTLVVIIIVYYAAWHYGSLVFKTSGVRKARRRR